MKTTLCASGDCPLRDLCGRSPDRTTTLDKRQSVTLFLWVSGPDGTPDCEGFRPRPVREREL